MANYYGMTRTNYFHVNDPEGLEKLLKTKVVCSDETLELFEKTDENGKTMFAFGGYTSIDGVYPSGRPANKNDYDEKKEFDEEEGPEDDFPDYNLFVKELQKFLVDGEAIIITEVGHEKLCYLTAYATVITKDDCKSVDLERSAVNKARYMLGNQEYDPHACY